MLAGKIGKGVQATEAAKAVVAKIENAVRREVITPDKLVRTPASDLYDKSCYMNTEKFWKDNEFMANLSERLDVCSRELHELPDGATNIFTKMIEEPNYPVPSGHKKYLRRVVNLDDNNILNSYDRKKMNMLLEEGGPLRTYIDKMRRLAKYKENL